MYEEYFKHINQNVTGDIKKFVDNEVFGDREYIFIEKVNGLNLGHCTRCHKDFLLSQNYKHNKGIICPKCGATLQVKLARYGRKDCFNDACFYFFEKSIIDPSVIVCKGYYVSRSYTENYKKPKTKYMLESVYLFGDKISKMLKTYYSNYYGERYEEKKSVFDFNQGWLAQSMCYISRESMEKTIKGTRFQYIPKELLQGYVSTVKVLDQFAKYPWLEQIYKIGFKNIVEAKIKGDNLYNCLNYKGKDIFKILKLSRKDAKDLIQSEERITPLFLNLYQLALKDNSRLTLDELDDIQGRYGYYFGYLKYVLKYTTLRKAVKYMSKQYKNYKKNFYGTGTEVITWGDYIGDCIKLEMDLKDEHVLFPKDIYSAHQNSTKQVKITANERLNKKIYKRVQALQHYCFENKNLLIRPAYSSNELIDEGKTLHHCVGTYAEKYANGKTNIMVIRKVSEPDKPYFTLELLDNKVTQCYGNHDCLPKEDVKEFVEAFKKAKLPLKNEINNKVRIPA